MNDDRPLQALDGLLAADGPLHHVAEDLHERYRQIYSLETVERCLIECYTLLERDARIPTYLSVLAGRFARERLDAAAKNQGVPMSTVPEVLFVCVHNAGRSQMAAALLDHYSAGRVHVRSAGSVPADQINPTVVEAMTEIGLDISKEFPKPLTDDVVQAADVVVTMGCGDACPIYPGKRYLDWELEDPANKPIAVVRQIRDRIAQHVQTLLQELSVTTAS